jgi:hypothetical protein
MQQNLHNQFYRPNTALCEKRIFVPEDSVSDFVGRGYVALYWSPPENFLINLPFSFFYSFIIIIRKIQKI